MALTIATSAGERELETLGSWASAMVLAECNNNPMSEARAAKPAGHEERNGISGIL
jgi:hypothetical protein